MTTLIDTSVLIDVLRGVDAAVTTLEHARTAGPLHASEITRLEILSGMRDHEREATESLLDALTWHSVDRAVSERAAELAREWRPGHSGIDVADFAIAATCGILGAELLTLNIRHFPMIPGLRRPY